MGLPRKSLIHCYECNDTPPGLIPVIHQDEDDKTKDKQEFICFNCMSIAIEEFNQLRHKYTDRLMSE